MCSSDLCKRVERVTAKTGRTSCTNWTISFGVSGFRTRTHLLHGHFIFLNLFERKTFFAFCMHHSKRGHQFSILSNIVCYFQSFTDLFRELNDREIQNHYEMNSEKVETWHGTIISPTWHVQKSRGLQQKLDTLRLQNGQSLLEYQGFRRELIGYTGTSFF